MKPSLRRHWRFLLGVAMGIVTGLIVPTTPMMQLLIGADVLFGVYLAATFAGTNRLTAQALCRHAQEEDEGTGIILLLGVLAVVVSLAAIFDALHDTNAAGWHRAGALLSVPLGWLTLHTLFAFRYAHLWYAPGAPPDPARSEEQRGLDFGGHVVEAGFDDFLYYSLTIGMTAQTSDTGVTTRAMRRLTLVHAVVSFFYNTVLIALAVNAGLRGS